MMINYLVANLELSAVNDDKLLVANLEARAVHDDKLSSCKSRREGYPR